MGILSAASFEIVAFLTLGFIVGLFFMAMAVMDMIAKKKRARAIAEFRRQRRYHQAEMQREREAHDTEIAVLRERLREQDDKPKVFDSIVACRIEPVRLLNRGEWRLWKMLERVVAGLPEKPLLFTQVPLGEILHIAPSAGTDAQRKCASQNLQCKRVDFAVTDYTGRFLLAIELHGAGHYQGTAAWRDQVKQALFRQAGKPLIEVSPQISIDELETTIRLALGHDVQRRQFVPSVMSPDARPQPV